MRVVNCKCDKEKFDFKFSCYVNFIHASEIVTNNRSKPITLIYKAFLLVEF